MKRFLFLFLTCACAWGIFVGLNPASAQQGKVAVPVQNSPIQTLIDDYIAAWPSRQNANGCFYDTLRKVLCRSRSYDEALLGAVLLHEGIRSKNAQYTQSGRRALEWELNQHHLSPPLSAFETFALGQALQYSPSIPTLNIKLRHWFVTRPNVKLGKNRWSNHMLVEALGVTYAEKLGVHRADTKANIAAMKSIMVQLGKQYNFSYSDPPGNPPAYRVIVTAMCMRLVSIGGLPWEFREHCVRMARSIRSLLSPRGDVALWGRSGGESWTLSLGAYTQLQAAQWDVTGEAPAWKNAAMKMLNRLSQYPRGKILPSLSLWKKGTPLGSLSSSVDEYASGPTYDALTALGLIWVRDMKVKPTAATVTPGKKRNIIVLTGKGSSRSISFFTPTTWMLWRPYSSWSTRGDTRLDGGIVSVMRKNIKGRWLSITSPSDIRQSQRSILPQMYVDGMWRTARVHEMSIFAKGDEQVLNMTTRFGRRLYLLQLETDNGKITLSSPVEGRWRTGWWSPKGRGGIFTKQGDETTLFSSVGSHGETERVEVRQKNLFVRFG